VDHLAEEEASREAVADGRGASCDSDRRRDGVRGVPRTPAVDGRARASGVATEIAQRSTTSLSVVERDQLRMATPKVL
jgi:hypothetical protein